MSVDGFIGMFVLLAGIAGYRKSKDKRFFYPIGFGIITNFYSLLLFFSIFTQNYNILGERYSNIFGYIYRISYVSLIILSIKNWKMYKSTWEKL